MNLDLHTLATAAGFGLVSQLVLVVVVAGAAFAAGHARGAAVTRERAFRHLSSPALQTIATGLTLLPDNLTERLDDLLSRAPWGPGHPAAGRHEGVQDPFDAQGQANLSRAYGEPEGGR